jgi:hypothetical protein
MAPPNAGSIASRSWRETERGGFVLPRFLNLFRKLSLTPNLSRDNDFARLADLLFLHGFLPSRDAF